MSSRVDARARSSARGTLPSSAPKRDRDALLTPAELQARVTELERRERFALETLTDVRAELAQRRAELVAPLVPADEAAVRTYLRSLDARWHGTPAEAAAIAADARGAEYSQRARDEYTSTLARIGTNRVLADGRAGNLDYDVAKGLYDNTISYSLATALEALDGLPPRPFTPANTLRPSRDVDAALKRLGIQVTIEFEEWAYRANGEKEYGTPEVDTKYTFGRDARAPTAGELAEMPYP